MMGEGVEEEHDLVRLKGRIGMKEEKAKRKKITRLLEDYTQFKKKNIKHFRFNGSPNSSNFSKLHLSRYLFDDSVFSVTRRYRSDVRQ